MLRLAFDRGVCHTSSLERIQVPLPLGCVLRCTLLQLVVGLHPILRLVVGFGNIVFPPAACARPRTHLKAELQPAHTFLVGLDFNVRYVYARS